MPGRADNSLGARERCRSDAGAMQEPETDATARERCGSEGEVLEQASDVGARVMLEQENKGAGGDGRGME